MLHAPNRIGFPEGNSARGQSSKQPARLGNTSSWRSDSCPPWFVARIVFFYADRRPLDSKCCAPDKRELRPGRSPANPHFHLFRMDWLHQKIVEPVPAAVPHGDWPGTCDAKAGRADGNGRRRQRRRHWMMKMDCSSTVGAANHIGYQPDNNASGRNSRRHGASGSSRKSRPAFGNKLFPQGTWSVGPGKPHCRRHGLLGQLSSRKGAGKRWRQINGAFLDRSEERRVGKECRN